MSMLELSLWWGLVLLGIGGSAVCSGLEVGLYTINRVLVRVHAAGGDRGRRARILESQITDSSPTLTALLVWNNAFNYVGTLAITTLITTLGLGDTEMILIQIVVLTPVLLVFAESTPKEVFRSNADTLMERFAYGILFMRLAVTWVPIVPDDPVDRQHRVQARRCRRVRFARRSARHRMADLIKFGAPGYERDPGLADRPGAGTPARDGQVRDDPAAQRRDRSARTGPSRRPASFIKGYPYSRYPVLTPKGQVIGILKGFDLYIGEDLDSQPKRVSRGCSTHRPACKSR